MARPWLYPLALLGLTLGLAWATWQFAPRFAPPEPAGLLALAAPHRLEVGVASYAWLGLEPPLGRYRLSLAVCPLDSARPEHEAPCSVVPTPWIDKRGPWWGNVWGLAPRPGSYRMHLLVQTPWFENGRSVAAREWRVVVAGH